MPYLYAHYYTGKMAVQRMSARAQRAVSAEPEAFFLGCQGADVFFYHHLLRMGFGERSIGSLFHRQQIDRVFSRMLELAREDGAWLSCFLGYLCHYALDCAAHPYINCRCCHEDHTRFEAHLDSALLLREGETLRSFPPWKLFEAGKALVQKLDGFYARTAEYAFGKDIRGVFTSAYRKMKRIQKIAYDPRRIKRPFFFALERLAGAPRLITGKLFENHLTDGIDYLNLARTPWHLPWDAGKKFTASFPKMMKSAAEETARMAEAVFRFLAGGEKQAALAVLQSRSLDTGLDWRENPEFTAVECVYAHGSRRK